MNAIDKATTTPGASVPAVNGDAGSIMAVIARAASDPSMDVEKVERLSALFERVRAREMEHTFNDAMAQAQAEMHAIAADAVNPQTKSKYASYAALDRVLRPIYTKHGFSLSFDSSDEAPEGMVRVLCYVSQGGHTRTYRANMPADGKGARGGDVMTKTHATGAAFTYGARYLLKMIFNVAVGEADDDGNSAGGGPPRITDAQATTLRDLIMDTETDIAKFYRIYRVARLEELPAADYATAVADLETVKERKAAKGREARK